MWYAGHNNTTKEYMKIIPCTSMDERYKIIATPINSNIFTDFDLKN